jgi:hypothetical protein
MWRLTNSADYVLGPPSVPVFDPVTMLRAFERQ